MFKMFKMFGIRFNNPESVFCKSYCQQLAATLTVNLIVLCHGIALGWVSPMLFKLQSNDSPVDFEVSVKEASWIGALISMGGLTGNIIFGTLVDLIGRKRCIYLLAAPHLCSWLMIFLANEVEYLYVARVLGGITGGGVLIIIPLFVADIANTRIRGTLGSLFCFALNIGILSGFIIASHIPYLVIPCVVGVIPWVYLFLAIRLPETPQHLLRKGLTDEAENSLKFYKNYKSDSKEAYQKFNSDFNDLKMSILSGKGDQRTSFKDACSKRSLKGLCSGVVLIMINSFSGLFTILNYSSIIFADSGSTMDPNTNTIIIGAVQILGSYCATFLVDKYGRKFLLMISTSGMCLGLTIIGGYSYLTNHNSLESVPWLPVVFLSFVIFTANIGVVAVTFVALVEVLPPRIRSLGSTFCLALLSIFITISLKAFPVLMAMIGLSGVMWIFASVAGCGFFYFLIFLPETRGMSLDDESAYK